MKWSFVSNSDKFIDSVILAVAEKEGDTYSPVYIQGSGYDVGAVMHRFENEYAKRNANAKIMRISGGDFYNMHIAGTSNAGDDDFAILSPVCDMLIFENIDAIRGNERLMQIFSRIFDRVYSEGGKIIIGGSCPLEKIPALAGRIRTKLECGIVCNLSA